MRRDQRVLAAIGVLIFVLSWTSTVTAEVDTAWVRRYDGTGNNADWAYALQVDATGNVYVTGSSDGSGHPEYPSDYATIKYGPDGDTLWVRRYDGAEGRGDAAYDLQVDAMGNVYVTGNSWGSGTIADYATIKYDPDGDTLWVRRYNGPGNGMDWADALQVDAGGNVYVTGNSEGSGTGRDYATIKYDPDGDTLWVRRYNGPGNGNDLAYSLQVDAAGNVYVTGESLGSGTGRDYATIKYGPDGSTLWVRRGNGSGNSDDIARALRVDGSGNVYVTGESVGSGTGRDYGTVKYGPGGAMLWVGRYNGPGNSDDIARALQVDALGNVYVTGESGANGTKADYATIKYGPDGDTLWVRRYDGGSESKNPTDVAHALQVDVAGNVYVTGESLGSDAYPDYATLQYDPDGNLLWVRRYDGPESSGDIATALEVDTAGNVYVTGMSPGGVTGQDYATIKYLPGITPIGTDVCVAVPPVFLCYDEVTGEGMTEITQSGSGPPPPMGFKIVPSAPPIYYEITTTATFTEAIVICFTYDPDDARGPESDLRLFHRVGDPAVWTDVTTSVDTEANRICGEITSLSLFILAEPSCSCPFQCDFDEDGFLTALDLATMIDILFAGSPDVSDPDCPNPRADFDCDKFSTALDLGNLIDHLFAGGNGPCEPCGP